VKIESKVLRLERKILGRGYGATAWATEAAEKHFALKRMSNNNEAFLAALRKINPDYKPAPPEPAEPPISNATTVEGYAADLVARFKVRENFTQWKQVRYAEGVKQLSERLKRIMGETAH
jgi:hypothetical protein